MKTPFELSQEAWSSSVGFRQRRRRYLRYTYGRQWEDLTRSPRDGSSVSEEVAAMQQGQVPHTNNLIRQLVKCVIGNFRSGIADNDPAAAEPVDTQTAERNELLELDCRMLEEFLISGCAIQRIVLERRPGGSGAWVDNVSPDDFFVNRFRDPRGHDIELIGMLHSMSIREVIMRYGSSSADAPQRIARAYDSTGSLPSAGAIGLSARSRFSDAGPGRCRVIEVWTLESRNMLRCHDPLDSCLFLSEQRMADEIRALNDRRNKNSLPTISTAEAVSLRWRCRIYTPLGEILDEYDSPFTHCGHPFALKFYPMVDGEVHSLVEDIIDQQRHINSLITLIDQIMRVSAKGVLLFPIDQKVDSMSWPDVGRAWAQPNAIIPYIPGQNETQPRQIITSGDTSGAYRLLETHLEMFQKGSGVSEALQGRLPQANASAALYDSQLRSSAVTLLDLLETFNTFRKQRNRKINLV